jgi:nitroimidazol reductase NimA-like FMN-containing flavoprotein (pyridoxamine 5'-phosphate oxidase superfamily)
MGIDLAGLEVVSDEECLALLASRSFGRVALCVGALPVIVPIHYAMLGSDPVFRTDAGTKLLAASAGHVLCLEIDEADPVAHRGWSVLVTGHAHIITDPVELAEAEALPLRPWVGHGDAFVRIETTLLSGRRILGPGRGPAVPRSGACAT